jgi:hypothetical protein
MDLRKGLAHRSAAHMLDIQGIKPQNLLEGGFFIFE